MEKRYILIAPIGVTTEHVKSWLTEESHEAIMLYLLHSKKSPKHDFPKIAKDLKKDLESVYRRLDIKLETIDDAFTIEPILDKIAGIIDAERNEDPSLANTQFILNITGGTNAMAAGTMVAATFLGTRAQYILEPQKDDPKDKSYVKEVPIKSVGIAKMNESQKEILTIIAENEYRVENTPSNFKAESTKGTITRQTLLKLYNERSEKLLKKDKKKFKKLTPTTLSGITDKLVAGNLIESIPYVEYYVLPNSKKFDEFNNSDTLDLKSDPPQVIYIEKRRMYGQTINNSKNVAWPLPLIQDKNGVTYKITPHGITHSRYAYLFNDPYEMKKK